MKTYTKILVISGFATASIAFYTSCQKETLHSGNIQNSSILDVSGDGTSTLVSSTMQSAFVTTSGLSEAELASLLKMKDEEKLARDVYSALYQKWGNIIFSRISAAENNHLNAVVRLLQYYGSPDTLAGEAGTFIDPDVQVLYRDLVAKGSESVEDAFKTGALIEEMDIKDLSDAVAATSNANIIMVYENLEKGSRNHLRSFYRQLLSLGVVYTPVYIAQAEYDQIVTSAMEKGAPYKMSGKGKGQGKMNGKN